MSRPDEGMIHAWLDGELDAAEAARIEALVRDDTEWAAAAAEARGFIAASARIVGALDQVPANVIPKATTADAKAQSPAPAVVAIHSARGSTRGTPWWAMRAAALLVIAVGTAVVVRNTSDDSRSVVTAQAKAKTGVAAPVAAEKKPVVTQSAPKVANEADAAFRTRALGDAKAKASGGGTPPPSPSAAPSAPGTLGSGAGVSARRDANDERRVAAADSLAPLGKIAAAGKPSDVKKEALKAAVELSPVTTTSASADRQSAPRVSAAVSALSTSEPQPSAPNNQIGFARTRNGPYVEECYREQNSASGAQPIVHRVGRVNDSTAAPALAVGLRAEAGSAAGATGAAGGASAGARSLSAPEAAALARALAMMKVHGDTLFVAGAPARIALKVSCTP